MCQALPGKNFGSYTWKGLCLEQHKNAAGLFYPSERTIGFATLNWQIGQWKAKYIPVPTYSYRGKTPAISNVLANLAYTQQQVRRSCWFNTKSNQAKELYNDWLTKVDKRSATAIQAYIVKVNMNITFPGVSVESMALTPLNTAPAATVTGIRDACWLLRDLHRMECLEFLSGLGSNPPAAQLQILAIDIQFKLATIIAIKHTVMEAKCLVAACTTQSIRRILQGTIFTQFIPRSRSCPN